MQYRIGEFYTRKEIHQLAHGVPLPKTGTGNWLTGYVKVQNDLIIFANVGQPGKTGHDFPNYINENTFTWYGKPNSHSNQAQIKKLLHGELTPKIFIRHDNSNPKFKFLGNVEIKSFKDHVPIDTPFKSCTAIEIKFNLLGIDNIEDLVDTKIDFNGIFDLCMDNLSGQNVGLRERLSGKYTLQEAGNVDGITRERIRQKEASFLRNYSKFHSVIIDELNNLNFPPNRIFYFWKLEQLSDFFFNVSVLIKTPSSPLLCVFESEACKLNFEVVDKLIIIYPKSKPSFTEVINAIKHNSLEEMIEEYLLTVGRMDILDQVTKKIQNSIPKSNAGQITYHLKREIPKLDHLVRVTDLSNLLIENHNLKAASNEVSAAISRNFPNFYQFKASLWGDESKFGIQDEEAVQEIFMWAVEIIHEKEQLIHVNEIFNDIPFSYDHFLNKEYISELTPFHIDWCLKKNADSTHRIIDQGKGRWISQQTIAQQTELKVRDIIVNYLEEAGGPRTFRDIHDHIRSIRAIADSFQLRPSTSLEGLVLIKPKLWGLKDRDMQITEDQEKKYIELILSEFENGNKILNENDITRIAQCLGIDQNLTFYQYSRLLLCHMSSQPMRSKYFIARFNRHTHDKCLVIDINSDIDPASVEFK